jgi:arylsulfatase A-like enzyme
VRDSSALVENSPADSVRFDQIIEIDRADEDCTSRVFEAARRWLARESSKGQFLLFIDCHGAHPPWYPPQTPDESDAELEAIETEQPVDGDADNGVAIDSSEAHESSEPVSAADQARQTYAAVVSHLDAELGSFLDFMRGRAEWEQSLVVITSDCGITLDDQQPVTLDGSNLHEGRTHVPLLIRMPGAHDPAARSPALVQPIDLMPTVCDAMDVAIPINVHGRSLLPIVRLQSRAVRDHALMADAGCPWAIRTPAWHLILPPTAADSEALSEPRLFIKPEDRWDQNDVAKQSPDVAEQLMQNLRTRIGSSC